MSLLSHLLSKPSAKLSEDIQTLANNYRYAIYYDLMGNTEDSLGAEIAFLMGQNRGSDFKKLLGKNRLSCSIIIPKPLGESVRRYQAAGYIILRDDGMQNLTQEIQKKIQEDDGRAKNKYRGIPLSSDANLFINYMLNQERRTIQGFEELMDREYDIQIEIRPRDIESGLHIFTK